MVRTQREIFLSRIPSTVGYSAGPTSDVPGYIVAFKDHPFEGASTEVLFDGSGAFDCVRFGSYDNLIHEKETG